MVHIDIYDTVTYVLRGVIYVLRGVMYVYHPIIIGVLTSRPLITSRTRKSAAKQWYGN